MKLSLDSVIIYTFDVNLLRDFYVNHFNLSILEEIKDEWVLLRAGHCSIGLHRVGEAYRNSNIQTQSETNIKLVFETTEDLSALREQLLSKGVAMRNIKTFDNYPFWVCDGVDPEGNVFQLKKAK
ncbi:MAG: hypothetical protein K2X48_17810 [Chitinophagaceae bacterium]|nr:hypothetical protein [Chitinophagaceae bacterium]MBX9785147.1 hypothetical protein [Chitinophagaceae bacterium]